jgi:microcompartment protein CcmK/EutM
MCLYEGFVARLKADGKAEIVISPSKPGIPGAPELTEKVCHRATKGSTLRIEALNCVGAGVGDLVLLSRRAGAVMKNVVVLLGMPVAGGISGLVGGLIFFDGLAFRVTATVIAAAFGLLLGLVIGAATYRRMSANDQPVIRRIIRSRTDTAFGPRGDRSRRRRTVSCEGKSVKEGCPQDSSCFSKAI